MFNSKHTNLHFHRIELWHIDTTQRNGKYTKMFSNSTYVAFSMLYMNASNYLGTKRLCACKLSENIGFFPADTCSYFF